MSITTALLVVFVQQWAHSYLRATQGELSSRVRAAQIYTFLNKGIHKWRLPRIVRAVPSLFHISLFLFFVGLAIWLININHVVGAIVIAWLGLCVYGYAFVTIVPIFYHDCPYYSPLSSSIWRFTVAVRYAASRLFPSPPLRRRQLSFSLRTARIRSALALPPDFINHPLSWTLKSLKRDDELEQLYDAIPTLCASHDDSLETFIVPNELRLTEALIGLLDRTFSSNMVSEPVQLRRINICTEALRATGQHLLGSWYFLRRVLLGEWQGFLGSVSVGLLVQSWKDMTHRATTFYAQCVVSAIIATVQAHDEAWTQLVMRHLAVSESTLQDYLVHGRQSVLLANLNHLVLHIIQLDVESLGEGAHQPILESLKILESMCKFDVWRTLPKLQHQFCDLWNQLVNKAHDSTHPGIRAISMGTLQHIYKIYVALHGGTEALPLAFSGSTSRDSAARNVRGHHHPVQDISTSHISEAASGNAGKFATAPNLPVPPTLPPPVSLPSTQSILASILTETPSGTAPTSIPVPSFISASRGPEAASGPGDAIKSTTSHTMTAPASIPSSASLPASRFIEAASDTADISDLPTTFNVPIPALHPSPGTVTPQVPGPSPDPSPHT